MGPEVMITVLLSFSHIQASCLDMAIIRWADPDFCPGRRNSQFFDPFQFMAVFKGLILDNIGKPLSLFETVDPGHIIPYIDQIDGIGCLLIVLVSLEQLFMGKGKNRLVHFVFLMISNIMPGFSQYRYMI